MNLSQELLEILITTSGIITLLLGIGALFKISERNQIILLNIGRALNLILVVGISIFYLRSHFQPIVTPNIALFKNGDYEFSFSLYLDAVSFPFLIVITLFGNVVTYFSQRYMHRESGVRRFFFIISLFLFGMNLAVLGSSLNILFAGWELVGISSYLLIAYYWEREKPVRNAQRVYLIYRICDLGLLFGALFAHNVLREAALFPELKNSINIDTLIHSLTISSQWTLGALIALAALGKSAQFPFLTWLPRALEGPTPSSAIFYGALSIHLGLYLLIRLEPIWNHIPGFSFFIGFIGILSAILASTFGRLQTTIKGQIAYASSAQVGVMFFEIALGLRTLAIVHFIGNSLYRGYQLLCAPSAVTEQLLLQSSMGGIVYRSKGILQFLMPRRFSESLYLFSLNEGYIDVLFQQFGQIILQLLTPVSRLFFPIWRPNREHKSRRIWKIFSVLIVATLSLYFIGFHFYPVLIGSIFIAGSLLFSIIAFQEKVNPFATLFFVWVSQTLPALATSLFVPQTVKLFCYYNFSIGVGFLFAIFSLFRISKERRWREAFRIKGLFQTYPNSSSLYFLSSISLTGVPFTFTFIGEDLLYHHLLPHSSLSAFIVCITYVLNGVSIIRLFGDIFLGKNNQTIPIQNFGLAPYPTFLAFCLFLGVQAIPVLAWR